MEEAKRYKTEAAQRDAFVKICHDMRTPLSSVMHLAQILEIEADRPDRVRERAAEIAVSAEYLLGWQTISWIFISSEAGASTLKRNLFRRMSWRRIFKKCCARK